MSPKERELWKIIQDMTVSAINNGKKAEFTIRQMRQWVIDRKIMRKKSSRSMSTPVPWDSHYLQSIASVLVGHKILKATQCGKKFTYSLERVPKGLDNFLA